MDYINRKMIISASLVTLLALTGCSNSDGENSSGTGGGGGGTPSSQASGSGMDGYIAGAHIYADIDNSGGETAGDLTATTENNGSYSFGTPAIAHGTYLYLSGGTDTATNTPFTGVLSASFQGTVPTVLSPLTTMVVALMQNEGLSYSEAVARVAAMMGITEAEVTADPYSPIDTDAFIASQRVVATATAMGGDFATAVAALASADMNATAAADATGGSAADAEAIDDFVVSLEAQLPASPTMDDLGAYQTLIDDAASDPANIPNTGDAAAVADVLSCLTFDAIKGSNTAENNITTILTLNACNDVNTSAVITWDSNNTALIALDGTIGSPVYVGGDVNLNVEVALGTATSDKSFALHVSRLDNHLPVANADINTTIEDNAVTFNVLANDTDADGDALTLTAVSNGLSFTADGSVTYAPALDFNGDFVFSYTVQDSWGGEANATVTVTVTPVNDAPVVQPIAPQIVSEDFITALIDVNATDVDSAAGSFAYSVVSITPAIVNATFIGSGLKLTSIPDLNGDANVTVMVSDGDKNDTASFILSVTPVNDAPVVTFTTQPIEIPESETDQNITVYYTITDIDTDVNSLYVQGVGTLGKYLPPVEWDKTHAVFNVPAYQNGDSNISIEGSDGDLVGSALLPVSITAVASTPIITAPTGELSVDLNVDPSYADIVVVPDNEPITVSVSNAGDPAIADVSVASYSNRILIIHPYNRGTMTVTLHAVNDTNTSLTSDINVSIHVFDPDNTAPVGSDSEFSVVADDVTVVNLNVNDPQGDVMTFSYPQLPEHGRIISVTSDGEMVYAAADGYIGDDSFTYVANDGDLDSNPVTVTVHVTATTNYTDTNDENPITLAQYNGYSAVSADGISMYSVWENGWDGTSEMEFERLVIDTTAHEVNIDDLNGTTQTIPYTINDPDDNEMLVDFDQNGTVDFKVKYIGTATKEEIELDKNMTLPTGATGYKLATLEIPEKYDVYDDPEYQDWNSSGGYNPYTDIDQYFTAVTFDGNTTSNWHSMWIDGYEFMFAPGSSLSDGSGTIVRYGHYNLDSSGEQLVVTNANAGSWTVVSVDGNDVIKVTPSVYGLTTVRTYQVDYDTDSYVHAGEYRGPNRATLEYKYDENTMYNVANSIMNQTVSTDVIDYDDASYHMLSFNSLPDIPLVTDTWMHAIWTYEDNGNYVIGMHSLRFDSNGTLEMVDWEDGEQNATYSLNGNIATIDGIGIDAKIIEKIEDNATRLSNDLGLPESAFGGYPVAYRMAHLEPQAELEVWEDTVIGNDGSTYPDLGAFETAFMNHEVAIDETQNGGRIVYHSGVSGVGGTLGVYDPAQGKLVNFNAGTWSYATVDGNQTMVFDIYVQHTREDFNAVAQIYGTGDISRGNYKAPDSGSVEYRFDDDTKNAVMTYLNDQNTSGTPVMLKGDTKIKRDIVSVAFTNDKMYGVDGEVNATTCEHSVATTYMQFNGTTGPDSSGTFVISNTSETLPYTSHDGKVVYVGGETLILKVNEELNATQLMDATSLYLPSAAHGYRVTYMQGSSYDGWEEIFLDADTVQYLESYYHNNHILDNGCGTPAP